MARTPKKRKGKKLGAPDEKMRSTPRLCSFFVFSNLLCWACSASIGSSSSSSSSGGSSGGITPPPRIINNDNGSKHYDSSRSTHQPPAWENRRQSVPPKQQHMLKELPVLAVDANEFIDENMAQAQRSTNLGKSEAGVYYKSEVFNSRPTMRASPNKLMGKKWKRKKRSLLKAEGDQLLKSLSKLGMHTTHGVFRAVNVTGNAAAVVAGGVFKLAGAAILDGVEGMEYASSRSPTEVPGISEAYRFLRKGLRKTGMAVYELGVAAENMTAEATEAAEETLRYMVESVVETAADLRTGDDPGKLSKEDIANGYFSAEEALIVDNIMLDIPMSTPDGQARDGSIDPAEGAPTANIPSNSSITGDGVDVFTGSGRQAAHVSDVHHPHLLALPPPHEASRLALGAGTRTEKAGPRTTFLERARRTVRRSIMRSNRLVPSMRFPQMVACGFVFACRAITTNPWCGAASFVGARMYLKFVEPIYLECLRERMMSDIKFEAVARLHEGSPERARWFNTAVVAMWVPMLEPLLSSYLARQITAGIERSLPSNVSWVGLGKITLGPTPPNIRYVRVQNVTSLAARTSMGQSNAVIDSVLLEAGQLGGEVTGENVVYLEMGVDWTSSRSKVSLKLGDQARRRRWRSIRSYVPTYRVKLTDFGIQAKVVLALAIGEGRPYVKRLWLSFSEPPRTHLSLEALHGMDLANLPVLRKHLRHLVLRLILPITEPKHLAVEMKPPPPPQNLNRRAALGSRVRAATPGIRRGVFSRVPLFGVRTLMGNRGDARAAAVRARRNADSLDFDADEYGPARQALEEATKRLLIEVGGDREETVMAAAHHAAPMDGVDGDRAESGAVAPGVTIIEASTRSRVEVPAPLLGGGEVREAMRRDGRIALEEEDNKADDNTSVLMEHIAEPAAARAVEDEQTEAVAAVTVEALTEVDHAEAHETKLTTGERRRDAVRAHRAEIRRQRAARVKRAEQRELDERGLTAAGNHPAERSTWREWFNGDERRRRWRLRSKVTGRVKGTASPERDELIKKVVALSRPLPDDDHDRFK